MKCRGLPALPTPCSGSAGISDSGHGNRNDGAPQRTAHTIKRLRAGNGCVIRDPQPARVRRRTVKKRNKAAWAVPSRQCRGSGSSLQQRARRKEFTHSQGLGASRVAPARAAHQQSWAPRQRAAPVRAGRRGDKELGESRERSNCQRAADSYERTISMRPAGTPPMVMSKKTTGFAICDELGLRGGVWMR